MKIPHSFLFFPAIFILSLAACASAPSIETFFIDAGVQQYFIYPSEMRGRGCTAMVDFTYRSSNEYIVCNITISTAEGVSRDYADLAFLLDGGKTIPLQGVELISMNRLGKEIRLGCRLPTVG